MGEQGISRRSFIGLGGVTAASIAAASFAGCSGGNPQSSANGGSDAPATTTWRTPASPISDDQIIETIAADIVVVGTGNAGAIALTTAIEAGASVIALQKESYSVAHGLYSGGYDTILQRAANITVDLSQWKTRWQQRSGNWASIPHLNLWVKYSGGIINRLFTLAVEEDCPIGPIVIYKEEENEDDWNTIPSTEHIIRNPNDESGEKEWSTDYLETFEYRDMCEWLTQRAIKLGADVRYETPAVELIRGGEPNGTNGRVEGVIAQDKDGNYIKCLATKGVILCAGGYSNNEEMKEEFLPHIAKLDSGYTTRSNVGDAHKMATWCGAQMRRAPHTSNPHYDPAMGVPNFVGTAYPWLRVNLNGERFSNEDMPYEMIYAQDLAQPECVHFQVFDDNYENDVYNIIPNAIFRFPWLFVPAVKKGVEEGTVYTGNTIEELAEAMGVPVNSLKATVDRYNELCKAGYDEDFGKQAGRMLPVEKAPFYAIKKRPAILDSMSGMMTNTDLQVLDENDTVIEGLYAAGNCQSPFFGGFVQQMNINGMGSGRAFTTGHVAALRACGIEDRLWPTTDELVKEHPEYLEIAREWEALIGQV